MARSRLGWVAALAGLIAGCSAGFPNVIEPSEIDSLRDGSPRLRRVRDLGAVHIGRAGALAAESDGSFVVGELVLIEGSGLGKQPTVGVGKRPLEVLWRTEGGGIIARLPPGVETGRGLLWVQNGAGRGELPVEISRLGLILDEKAERLHTVRLSRAGGGVDALPTQIATVAAPIRLPGARALALSSDGSAAYVLLGAVGAGQKLAIIDLVAPGGPKLADTRPLRHPVHSLAASEREKVLALVGPEQVTLWDISEGRRPAAWPAAALPEEVRGAHTAALDPGGQRLALGIAEGNQVVFVEVKPSRDRVLVRPLGSLAALPGIRQPLLHLLRFASDGATLWVSAGDSARSRGEGHQPTRLLAIATELPDGAAAEGDRGYAVLKTVELRDAGAPVGLALSRTPPIASGTTIRTPPEKAELFLTTITPSALDGGDKAGGAESTLVRGDPQGVAEPLLRTGDRLLGIDLTPAADVVLTARLGSGPDGLKVTAADPRKPGGESAGITIPLGAGRSDADGSDGKVDVALQP